MNLFFSFLGALIMSFALAMILARLMFKEIDDFFEKHPFLSWAIWGFVIFSGMVLYVM